MTEVIDINEERDPNLVNASPTKRFFVEMLTRDIEVQDAILDLLDNCVDGILRTLAGNDDNDLPYQNFAAHIDFSAEAFSIKDNCGGIPKDVAIKYAFMMGRPDDDRDKELATVGMYGIGMKRAIFKLGRLCSVKSFRADGAFEVKIGPEWMKDDKSWELSMEEVENNDQPGTHISITDFPKNISAFFQPGMDIYHLLPAVIAQHFSFIIAKGFKIYVNGTEIIPKKVSFLVSSDGQLKENSISPYLFQGVINDVNVYLVVGFYKPMLDPDELEEEAKSRRSTEDAGWTVVCNNRVVLYNDKTILTGWGEANVPSYHTQFIGIYGIVFFESNHASNLPLTTTKRGIDGSSTIYLRVKNRMREGLKKFTDYTNYWKPYNQEQKSFAEHAVSLDVVSLAKTKPDGSWSSIRGSDTEYKLDLPLKRPTLENTDPMQQIKFFKKKSEVDQIKEHFYQEDQAVKPSEIGILCFETVLNDLQK